jgi:uncharacterized protein YkwD
MRRIFMLIVVAGISVGLMRPAGAVTTTEAAAETKLFAVINAKRVAIGLPALKLHTYIRTEARKHSAYMASQGKISHDGFSGRFSRIRSKDSGIRAMCENVAWVKGYSSYTDAVNAIYKAWYRSSGHYKCMFDKLGFRTRSGAIGMVYRNGAWWATYEAASDTTP